MQDIISQVFRVMLKTLLSRKQDHANTTGSIFLKIGRLVVVQLRSYKFLTVIWVIICIFCSLVEVYPLNCAIPIESHTVNQFFSFTNSRLVIIIQSSY